MTGYKTLIVNVIMVVAALAGLNVSPELAAEYAQAFVVAWGGINVVLRAISKGPIFGGSKPPRAISAWLAVAVAFTLAGCAPATIAAIATIVSATVPAALVTYTAIEAGSDAVGAADGTEAKIKAGLEAYCGADRARALDRAALAQALRATGTPDPELAALVDSLALAGRALCAAHP